jgi:hypothetical protein
MCECLEILGASTSWKHQGLSRSTQRKIFQVRIQVELPVNTASLWLHRRELLELLGDYQCLKRGVVYIKEFAAGD